MSRGTLLAAAAAAALAGAAPAPARATGEDAAALLEEGRACVVRKDLRAAHVAFARSLRASAGQDGKDAARDELLRLATPPPPAMDPREREIVAGRIHEERERYLREVASGLLGRKKFRGALALLEVVKGTLEEDAKSKVIGEPKAAERSEREVVDLRVRILNELSDAGRAEADQIVEAAKGDLKRLAREAERIRKEGKPLAARRILMEIVLHPAAAEEDRARARAGAAAIEKEVLSDLDPEERKTVDEALRNPVFGRLATLPSQEFLFIGDADLLARIPERSRHVFDVSFLALTDLAGRVPNPEGDRVTVFFKELWDFGGGIGGGRRIDIGRADPRSKQAVLVSTGLYFHELSHCVFDLEPGFPGWVEGIANFGAAFCASFLRLETDRWQSAEGNLEAFRRDFLGREETYWRMAPYGPSAGWFLHWIEAHGKRPSGGYDWVRYGRVFRAWKALPAPPETVPAIARAFGTLLVEQFGAEAWKELEAHGFPCEGGPAEAALDARVRPDLLGRARAGDADAMGTLLRDHPGSREAAEVRRMDLRAGGEFSGATAEAQAALGAVRGWRVCGPFYPPERGDGLATVFAPERGQFFGREYGDTRQVARWYRPATESPVLEDPTGLVAARWAYPEGSATYGLAEVEVPAAVEGFAWVTTEDRWALWADGRLVEKQDWGAGRAVPDRDRVPLALAAGRHRLLLKVTTPRSGPTFALRLTDRAGRGVPGMRCLDPAEGEADPPRPGKGKAVHRDDFARAALGAAWTTGPGGFDVRNRQMAGVDSRGAVPWRKYSVRPGFPQDSPSNQATLDPRLAAKAGEDLRVELGLALPAPGHPKVAVTLDAEEAAGGLTGWTVVVVPAGKGVDVRLEHYDRLLYLATDVEAPRGKDHVLLVERREGFVTVTLDGVVALDRISAPALRRRGLRLCTWDASPAFTRFTLERLE